MPFLATQWGSEDWSATLIEALTLESALLKAGATRTIAAGRVVHVPRLKINPAADWVAELTALPSDSGSADTLTLLPKKVGNVLQLSTESIEDASVDELNAVGQAMVRGVATKLDATAFSASAATATAPAGLLSYTLPGSGAGGTIDIDHLLDGVGAVESHGGVPDSVFVNPADITVLRKLKTTQGAYLLQPDPQQPGAVRVAGATLYPCPIAAGTALVAEARYVQLAIRRDAAVKFSEDAAFSSDAVTARVTMRVDWSVADPNAFYVVHP